MRVLPVPNVNVEPGSLKVIRNSQQNEGVLPPTISASRGTTMPVCGGVEAYNKRSLRVKYCSQGVQTSFYKSTPSAQDPDVPNALKQRDLRGTSRYSRFLFERIPDTQGFWRVVSSNLFKTTERPHQHTSLLHTYHKLSAEYCRKRRLRIQNISAGCELN